MKNKRYSRLLIYFPFEPVQRFGSGPSVVKVSTYGLMNIHLQSNGGGRRHALEKPADEFLNVNL